jgi:uncharacterized protein YigE (DUF2233 family)
MTNRFIVAKLHTAGPIRHYADGLETGGSVQRRSCATKPFHRPVRQLAATLVMLTGAVTSACADAQETARTRQSSAVSCSVDTIAGAHYDLCEFPAEALSFRLVSVDANGHRIASIARLDSIARSRSEHLVFATNAGMYEPDSTATGLLIVEGREEHPLNVSRGPRNPCSVANFFCPPNGVFFVINGRARIVTTAEYARLATTWRWRTPRYATQSGPLLMRSGRLARPFDRASTSAKLRNGVCIRADGSVLFALADSVTFWAFAEAFRGRLRCTDALFLDGSVSQLYTGDGAPPPGGRFSAIFAAFARSTQD